jgi:uroporphyrinogen decarboxylase
MTAKMTPKQRFMNCLTFQPVDHVPVMEICLWQQTHDRWIQEGMPANVNSAFMLGCDYFGLEGYATVQIDAIGPRPPLPDQVLAEDEESVIFTDGFGRTRKALKTGTVRGQRMSMDTYIDFPVKDRASWRAYRRRYEGPQAERYPTDWESRKQAALASDKPLTLLDPLSGTFGYYSMLRNWMGTEGLSYLLYDDPALVQECLEFLSDFAIALLTRAVKDIRFDFYYVHEDMSYKNGPLVSPDMFQRFFLPEYKKLVGFLKANGLQVVLVDTDGNHEALIPLFLEAGIDGFGPIERAADMDPVKLRRQYGKRIAMVGGIDKRAIARGRKAIEAEIDRTIRPIVDEGGFIPTIDHAIPPDVSLADFRYYLDLKRKALGG